MPARLASRLSIRWRLALGSALLTFVILCAFAIAVGLLTGRRIREDFEVHTARSADKLAQRIDVAYDASQGTLVYHGPELQAFASGDDARIRVLLASGQRYTSTKGAPDFGLTPDGSATINGYLVETRYDRLTDGGYLIIQYARRLGDVEKTLDRLRFFLVLGVLAGAGLSLGAGLLIARRAMHPVGQLTAAAREITRTRDPNRSVPIPPTHDEVAELARTLDEMLRALEAGRAETASALQRQREFVADASHELRTPLTSVLANLELLAEVLDGESGEAAQSALRSSRRMRRLVADLLLLARADANRAAVRLPTDLGRVLVEAASELGPLAEEHDLQVDAEPVIVEGARDDLHRVALNLMENALRHTPPGTHVRASLRRAGSEAVLTVEDDGPGIPSTMRDRLFERFVRGGGDRGGSFGLGLSIVRAVAETHGGTVHLETPPDGGARFVVRLPASGIAQTAAVTA